MSSTGEEKIPLSRTILSLFRHQVVSISLVLVAMWIVLALLSPYFLTFHNLLEITLQTSVIAIIAAGMSFVIFAGGIDLSVGSVFAMAAVAGGVAFQKTGSVTLCIVVSLLTGAAAGLLNGLAVVGFRIPAFVATLGMMGIARGFALIFCGGVPIYGLPPSYTTIGQGKWLEIPIPTLITLALFIVFFMVLRNTRFGRFTYAIGSNLEASRLSGVKVGWMIPIIFMLCGATSALASIIEAARLGTMQPAGGNGYELLAIGAVFIGGASISGGEGHIFATLIGALLVTTIRNGLNILGVNAFYQYVANGLIIVLAVAADQMRKRR